MSNPQIPEINTEVLKLQFYILSHIIFPYILPQSKLVKF